MKTLRFISQPLVILHLILIVQWGIFLGTTLQPYTLHVPNRTYVLLRGHLIYTSLIRQARDSSAWNIKTTHTTRPTPAVYGHMFFVLLGKLSGVFHIDPPMMYMAARMTAAVILFWSTYWFITVLLPKSAHSLAILFILGLEPGPMISTISQSLSTWRPSIFSYYPQIVSYRHFGLPHHTLGEAIGLLFIGMAVLAVSKPTTNRLISLAVLGIVGTTILPPYFIIIALSVFFPWTLYSLVTRSLKKTFLPMCIVVGSIAIVSLFMRKQFENAGYPWKDFNQDEKRWVTNSEVLISYLSTLLLYVPFITILWARCITIWQRIDIQLRRTLLIMTTWTIIPPLLVPLSGQSWFPIANFRLMDGYNYAPAGILASLGFIQLLRIITHAKLSRVISGFILSALLCSTGFLTYFYTTLTITEQSMLWTNAYISNDHFKAFKFLETVPKMSGVMISNHFGEIAPEYATIRSFIGSTPGYVDWDQRFWIVGKFYSVALSVDETREMLTREDISYVYYGDAEKSINISGKPLYPELLTPVFVTPDVTIYKVK